MPQNEQGTIRIAAPSAKYPSDDVSSTDLMAGAVAVVDASPRVMERATADFSRLDSDPEAAEALRSEWLRTGCVARAEDGWHCRWGSCDPQVQGRAR